ncbi:MAG: 2-oxoacid:acceptor oxidoreductase family protein [Anaerolineae bacterium]
MATKTAVRDELLEIRWHGRGGQGVVTAGKLLAHAALDAGLYFQAFPDYGPERMGAPIRAFTRLSGNPIHVHSQITEPNVVVILDPTVLGPVDVTEGLDEDGVLVVNTEASPAEIREKLDWRTGKVFTVDASGIALKHMNREVTNTPMLGALSAAIEVVGLEELEEQIRHQFERKFGEETVKANIAAMREAAEKLKEG